MNRKITAIFVLTLVGIPIVATASAYELKTESASTIPIITGPTTGTLGKSYEYSITYTDPDGEDVYYKIYWGDCMVIFNDGPHKSGETIKRSHAWCEICCGPGDFTIRVQATDGNGGQSQLGTLDVTMNKNKDYKSYHSFFNNFFESHQNLFPMLRQLLLKL